MSDQLSIVIADDHPIFRTGLRRIIERDHALRIVAEANDGLEALAAVRTLDPEILLLDLRMPKMDGLAVASAIHAERGTVGMLVLTMLEDEEVFNEALEYGVRGYLLKDCAEHALLRAIHTVSTNRYYICPHFNSGDGHYASAQAYVAAPRLHLDLLTTAERRVLRLVAESLKSSQIAETLSISVRTVDHHRENICRKLGLSGAYALLRFALAHKEVM